MFLFIYCWLWYWKMMTAIIFYCIWWAYITTMTTILNDMCSFELRDQQQLVINIVLYMQKKKKMPSSVLVNENKHKTSLCTVVQRMILMESKVGFLFHLRSSVYVHWFHWLEHCIHWPLVVLGRQRRHFLLHFDFVLFRFEVTKFKFNIDDKLI